MTLIIRYLKGNEQHENHLEARRLVSKVVRFTMIYGVLYKRKFSGPYLKCATPKKAQYVLKKLHEE